MPVRFPTTESLFPPVELTAGDCQLYEQRAATLVRNALAEYDNYNDVLHRQLDKKMWKPVKTRENLTVYRERGTHPVQMQTPKPQQTSLSSTLALGATKIGGWFVNPDKDNSDWSLPPLLAVGSIAGTLDDVMYGVSTFDATSMFLKSTYTDNELVDGEVLYSIKTPTPAKPYEFVGLKWIVKTHPAGINALVWPRDVVYLESTGILKRPNGERIGYQLMHSVNLPECGDLRDKGILRATLSSCFLFKQLPKGAVDVYMKAHVEPNGKVSDAIAIKSTAYSLIYCWKVVNCAQRKKLAWKLQTRLQQQQTGMEEMDPFTGTRRGSRTSNCGICSKTVGKLRNAVTCELCDAPICSKCRVQKKLSFKGARAKHVEQRVAVFCVSCFSATSQTGAFIIAREEVQSTCWDGNNASHSNNKTATASSSSPSSNESRRSSERTTTNYQSDRSTATSSVSSPTSAADKQPLESAWKPRFSHSFDITAPIAEPRVQEIAFHAGASLDELDGAFDADHIYNTAPQRMSTKNNISDSYTHSAQGLTHQQQLWLQMAELRNAAENVYQITKQTGESHLNSNNSSRSVQLWDTESKSESVRDFDAGFSAFEGLRTKKFESMSDDGDGETDERLERFKAFVEKLEIDLDDPVDTLNDLDELEELDLSEKDLAELPDDLMDAVPPNLRTLALEKNRLTRLPDGIAAFSQITELYLRENQLAGLPAAIGELTKLESLYLEDNQITADGVPQEIAKLAESLLGLCLHRNLLTSLPASVCQLTLLEELYLNGNQLEYLPDEIGLLVNLRELDIPGNKLETLPSSFSSLCNLEILHAEENKLIALPKGLGNLGSLRKVYLQNNKLTKLHASLGRCAKVEVLNVEDNCLGKVAKRIGELPKLKHLLLANNQITELPFNPLEKAPQLRRLTLSGNQLSPQTMELEQKVALQQVTEEGDEEEEE